MSITEKTYGVRSGWICGGDFTFPGIYRGGEEMSLVALSVAGEGLREQAPTRSWSPEEIRRLRAADMYRRRIEGWPNAGLAALYNVSVRWVIHEIQSIPAPVARAIREAHQRGTFRVG